jgi:hypothetical protein
MLVNSPGFTAVALATLALGIGVNTAIFTLIDAVLLSKLPVQNPQELVLFSDDPSEGTLTGTETGHWFVFSHVDYLYFRQHNESFQDLCAFQEDRNRVRVRVAGTKEGSAPESARSKLVSGNYFKLLGVNAIAGRTLTPEDGFGGDWGEKGAGQGEHRSTPHQPPTQSGEQVSQGLSGVRVAALLANPPRWESYA